MNRKICSWDSRSGMHFVSVALLLVFALGCSVEAKGTGDAGPPGPAGATGLTGAPGPVGPQGATGPQGVAGPQGIQGPMGPAGLSWKGQWSTTATYAVNDAVFSNGSAYVAVNANTNSVPPSTDWSLLASKGDLGPQGPIGATGPTGPQGLQGAQGPQGPSGVHKVFFNNSSFTAAAGFVCQMPAYVAGTNEAVIMHPSISCSSVAAGGQIGVRSAWNAGAGDQTLSWTLINTNSGTTATYMAVSNSGYMALTAGTSYTFEAQLYLTGTLSGTCYCDFVAEVVGL